MIKERIFKILGLRMEKKSIKEIAEELNLSEVTIIDNLKIGYKKSNAMDKIRLDKIAYEVKSRPKDKKLEEKLELQMQSESVKELSKILGCTESTIRLNLKEILREENELINNKLKEISDLIEQYY